MYKITNFKYKQLTISPVRTIFSSEKEGLKLQLSLNVFQYLASTLTESSALYTEGCTDPFCGGLIMTVKFK